MTLLEAEPRVESQDNGETAYQTAKEVLKKYPEVISILGTFSSTCARHRPRLSKNSGGALSPPARACPPPTPRSSRTAPFDPDPLGSCRRRLRHGTSLATKILNGERSKTASTSGVKGYESMHLLVAPPMKRRTKTGIKTRCA